MLTIARELPHICPDAYDSIGDMLRALTGYGTALYMADYWDHIHTIGEWRKRITATRLAGEHYHDYPVLITWGRFPAEYNSYITRGCVWRITGWDDTQQYFRTDDSPLFLLMEHTAESFLLRTLRAQEIAARDRKHKHQTSARLQRAG